MTSCRLCLAARQLCQHAAHGLGPAMPFFEALPTAAPLLQVNNLREIQALRRLSPHQNIIKLLEVL